MDRMMAELMGREDGYCRGLGGSMHIAALDLNILGCNGIVAAGVPIGAGAALAAKIQGTDRVALTFFGDGGANQGVVHETMNLASVWKLPFIFLCENNKYALSTDTKRTTAGEIAKRAAGYDMPHARVDGNDVLAVYEAVKEAVARARRGEGPTFVEAVTYRWGGHSMRANLPDYRTKEEEREWIERDPIVRFGHQVVETEGPDVDAAQGARADGRAGARRGGPLRHGQPGADRRDDGVVGLRAPRPGEGADVAGHPAARHERGAQRGVPPGDGPGLHACS